MKDLFTAKARVIATTATEASIDLTIPLPAIIERMNEGNKLTLLRIIMCSGLKGFTTAAREIVNSPTFDE